MFKKFGIVLSQRSTWAGFVWLLAAAGVHFTEPQAHAVEVAGMALAGLIGVFVKD
jgi:hypothetical protein